MPGIGSILAYTIASEIADISPFSTAKNFVDYTGLCPRVYRSGGVDRRGRIAKNGPTYLRWALIEASIHACHHPLYQPAYDRTKARLGRSRGGEIARIELGRQLTESIWHMLTEGEVSLRQGPRLVLWSRDDPVLSWTAGTFSHPT